MRLTVLGCFGPFPAAGGACSGYLVESGDTRLLLDCGSGVLRNLFRVCPLSGLSGAVISHLHMDHASDLGVLRYALEQSGRRLPIVAPGTPADAATLFLDHEAFLWEPSEPAHTYAFGCLTVRLFSVRHPVETYAVSVTDGIRTLFYTGDTGYFPALADDAAGADMILADTCFSEAAAANKPGLHMSASQAARLLREAGAGRLLCTHRFGGGDPDKQPDSGMTLTEFVQEMTTYDI